MRLLPALPLMVAAAALGCTGQPGSPNPSASTGAQVSASTAPGASPSATTPIAAAGKASFTLSVDGVDYPIPDTFRFFPTDLLGKRSRFSIAAGEDTPSKGFGNATMLFGSAKGLFPDFSIEKDPALVMNATVAIHLKEGFAGVQSFYLGGNTSKENEWRFTAVGGKVEGVMDMLVARVTTSVAQEIPRQKVRFTFSFTQEPLK